MLINRNEYGNQKSYIKIRRLFYFGYQLTCYLRIANYFKKINAKKIYGNQRKIIENY